MLPGRAVFLLRRAARARRPLLGRKRLDDADGGGNRGYDCLRDGCFLRAESISLLLGMIEMAIM